MIAVTAKPVGHLQPRARHTAGVRATTVVHAASISAENGGRPISGRARFSAANTDTRKKTWPSQGRGSTSARYQGSNVATSTRITSSASRTTFGEASVVDAQYGGSKKSRTP
jgi:hypothetical protein